MSDKIECRLGTQEDLEAIATVVQSLAHRYQGDAISLLALLRLLETLHRTIRDELFQVSLPNNRQNLYSLLKDIEAEGGWPYIPRMRLRALLSNLLVEQPEENGSNPTSSESHPDSDDSH
ncbi:MAG: hypothetical protein ACFE0J_25725 [Elainellaceae cyanobacterium]